MLEYSQTEQKKKTDEKIIIIIRQIKDINKTLREAKEPEK
jgi:hypothetical protein